MAVTLNELPCLVREEITPVLNLLRDETCKQVRESVRKAIRDKLDSQPEAAEEGRPTSGILSKIP